MDEDSSNIVIEIKRRDPGKPLVFMHVPKCGGTSLDVSLMAALGITDAKRFFGTVLHGELPIETYASWESDALDHVAINDTMFQQDNMYVVAHASYQELFIRHPDGQFITFIREPICRLLSLRTFLRSFSDQMICYFGNYGIAALRARLPLKEFLGHPYYAAGCDNVVTRMLLHRDDRIPSHAFIDPVHDAGLIADAKRKLTEFAGVFALEDDALIGKLSQFFDSDFSLSRENEAIQVPDGLSCNLDEELSRDALDLLYRHTRLDIHLWEMAMGYLDEKNMNDRRIGLIAKCVSRHSGLLSGGQGRRN